MKMSAKRKNTIIKTYRNSTGGGPPPVNDLDEVDKAVIKILEPTLLEGDTEIQESDCIIHFEEDLHSFTVRKITCFLFLILIYVFFSRTTPLIIRWKN